MPNMVYGDVRARRLPNVGERDHQYAYPDGLKLRPGSDLHNSLRDMLLEKTTASFNVTSARFDSWRTIDKTLTAYQFVDQEEKDLEDEDERTPVSIVFPYTYAMLETLLTYLTTVFFSEPVFRYEGVGPEDTIGAILLEHVVEWQNHKAKNRLALHTYFRDCLAYGTGAVAPRWEVRRAKRRVKKTVDAFGGVQISRALVDTVQFEGSVMYNIDPYRLILDPHVPIHKVQDGEFVGWIDTSNFVNLLTQEQEIDSPYFNVKYLKEMRHAISQFSEDESARRWKTETASEDRSEATNRVDVIYLYVNLIPRDWELGDSEYPEKWLFALAGDEIIIMAQKLDFDHGLYPLVTGAPDFDGYTSVPLSRLEILSGLQKTLDFLFNSHISNVKKAVNDMLVVDPYMVNIADVANPKPGKIIRLRKPAWGRGVKDAIMQLGISDITRGNIQDSEWIVQWMQRIVSADDAVMGVMRTGGPERLTGQEFQGTRNAAVSRLARIAQVISMMGMQDLGAMMASHTQQYMSQDVWVNLTGEWKQRLAQEFGTASMPSKMLVSPEDLSINYDITTKDASIPGMDGSEAMLKMFEVLSKDAELRQGFDMFRIFEHIARGAGAKNVQDFRKQQAPQVMMDEEIEKQVQAGNLIPAQMGGANGGG